MVTPSGLAWLATPDRAISWSVALGLAPDVAALLDRSAPTADATTATTANATPAWFRPRHKATRPAQMFAAILDIGGAVVNLPSFLRPMRGWLPF